MHRIDNSSAITVMPPRKPQGTDGYFTQGDMTTGQLATIVEADILNAIMMEIANVVTRAGIALNKTDDTQLWQAIQGLLAGPAGGDLSGRYPNPTFNLNLPHVWNAPQGLNNGVPLQARDPAGNLRNLLWHSGDNYVNTVGGTNGWRVLNMAQNTQNLGVDEAGNVSVRSQLTANVLTGGQVTSNGNMNAAGQFSSNTVISNGITSNFDITAYRNITAGNQVTAEAILSHGFIRANGDLNTDAHIWAGNGIDTSNGNITANNGRLRASTGSSGDGNSAVLLNEFPNGGSWTRLPNGLMIQWGEMTTANWTGVSLPVAFPNVCYAIVVSESEANGNTWGPRNPTVHGIGDRNNWSFTHWTLQWNGSTWIDGSNSFCFIAIGA